MTHLINIVKKLKNNSFIKLSHTLHLKKDRINTLALFILKNEYPEKELIQLLNVLDKYISNSFYTISYLQNILKKISKNDII